MKKATLFDIPEKSAMYGDDKYSRSVNIPQYLPSAQKPNVACLYNDSKYEKLIYNINHSNASEEEKKFLRLAASRHIVFNYAQIADYYAHSSKEIQELMEESALVIIDIDDAIANGYVKLSNRLKEIRNDGKLAKQAKDIPN